MVKLAKGYADEQVELKMQEDKVRREIAAIAERDSDVESFIRFVRKHSTIRRLTPAILNQFIDHIEIHQAEKRKGIWAQQIDIYYNCIGKISIPDTPRTKPKEIAMQTREGVVLQLADRKSVEAIAS